MTLNENTNASDTIEEEIEDLDHGSACNQGDVVDESDITGLDATTDAEENTPPVVLEGEIIPPRKAPQPKTATHNLSEEDIYYFAALDDGASSAVLEASAKLDWTDITDRQKKELCASASRIRSRCDRIAADVLANGKDLLEAKNILDHGKFGPWLAAEFNWSNTTAQRFMNYARHFADTPAVVAALPHATLDKLVAKGTPQEVRDEIAKKIEAGIVLTGDQIAEKIKQGKEAARPAKEQEPIKRQAKTLGGMTPEKRAAHEQAEKARDNWAEKAEVERELREKAAQERAEADKRPSDAETRKKAAAKIAFDIRKAFGSSFSVIGRALEVIGPVLLYDALMELHRQKQTVATTPTPQQP
ncbi:DUF3102 domain-containing protein [Mesorhizobium sp. LHD-90]|uniref:DUF3102 domain-containing protein n=1 Tax=Mesorhizobium sp. LHD-90 TaxID=3071414 RepID=UPI0027E007BA|nr:DUF3102 domain-containing protein [Mesorhizobium sp. LHD-90]MDQ6436644.1 DUF3102 domain-containing protein [Mesorhizobium sp. LHD-90]